MLNSEQKIQTPTSASIAENRLLGAATGKLKKL